jgi:hypothetical protein
MTPLDSGARFQETSEISDLTPSDRNTQQGKPASFVNVITANDQKRNRNDVTDFSDGNGFVKNSSSRVLSISDQHLIHNLHDTDGNDVNETY